jgi:hypothetical protein
MHIRFSEPPRLSVPGDRFGIHGGWPFRVYLETGMPPVFGKEDFCVEEAVGDLSLTGVVPCLRLLTIPFPKYKEESPRIGESMARYRMLVP